MPATGIMIFDGLALATIEANMITGTLTGKAAFVDTRTGATHGFTEGTGITWSEETKSALRALAESMEKDLGRKHFQGTSEATTKEGLQTELGGLGEHLGDDTPSV